MNMDLTVEEMLQSLAEVQNKLFRSEWDRLMHMEEEPVTLIDTSTIEAA